MGWIQARPSNPMEQLALGALNVGEQIMNTMQDGNKATKEFNIDTAVMKIHSKTEMGHGNAMLPPSEDDSDESDESRRRKRSIHEEHNMEHRGKRSPCFKKMPTESSDDVEARRKAAARKRAANNAVRSRIMRTINVKQKKKKFHRERRQATQSGGAPGQQGPNLGDRVKGMWLALVDNVFDAMQQMRQQIKGAAAQATGGN